MTHKHDWKRSKRKHKRPGRFFVECSVYGCNERREASELRIFKPRRRKDPRDVRKSRGVKLSDNEMKRIHAASLSAQKLLNWALTHHPEIVYTIAV